MTFCIQHRLLAYAPELAGLAADAMKIADMSDQVLKGPHLCSPGHVSVLPIVLVSHSPGTNVMHVLRDGCENKTRSSRMICCGAV